MPFEVMEIPELNNGVDTAASPTERMFRRADNASLLACCRARISMTTITASELHISYRHVSECCSDIAD